MSSIQEILDLTFDPEEIWRVSARIKKGYPGFNNFDKMDLDTLSSAFSYLRSMTFYPGRYCGKRHHGRLIEILKRAEDEMLKRIPHKFGERMRDSENGTVTIELLKSPNTDWDYMCVAGGPTIYLRKDDIDNILAALPDGSYQLEVISNEYGTSQKITLRICC